jgi:hypothetical protein
MSFHDVATSVFTIDSKNRSFQLRGDFLADIHGASLIRYFRDGADLVIGRDVEQGLASCFAGCQNMSKMRFESASRISVLDESVFYGSSLQSILVPCSIRTVGFGSFAHYRDLSRVIFESDCQVSASLGDAHSHVRDCH